jgi:hypothetical protein
VLHHAREINESNVDEFDVLVLDVLQYIVGVLEHGTSVLASRGDFHR